MKTCPTCQMEFDEAEGSCPVCEEMTRHEDAPAAPLPSPTPPQPPPPAVKPEDQQRLKALRDRLAAEAGAAPALEKELEPGLELRLKEPPPPARPVRETDDDEDMSVEEIAALARSKLFVVGLLGFPAGGKTWFLNRLKWICQQRGDLTPIPEAAEDRKPAGQTIKIRPHRFLKRGAGFAVIDIPGERFLEAVRDKFAHDSTLLRAVKACDALLLLLPADEALFAERADALHEGDQLHEVSPDQQAAVDRARDEARGRREFLTAQLKAATRAAAAGRKASKDKPANRAAATELKAAEAEKLRIRAEIAALDADEGRAVGEHLASTNERINLFINGVGRMAGVISMMDRSRFGDLPEAYSDAAVADHILSEDFQPCDRPTFIALTKSDLLDDPSPVVRSLVKGREDQEEVLEDYDLDPLHTVQVFRPHLANAFNRWFHWSKFDFVTAFQGHKGGTVIRYATPHRGVDAVIEWIEWASGSIGWRPRDWGEIDLARKIRRFRDGGGPAHRVIGARKGRERA